jgi:hypothetical protein
VYARYRQVYSQYDGVSHIRVGFSTNRPLLPSDGILIVSTVIVSFCFPLWIILLL